jgi:hypothetical protein
MPKTTLPPDVAKARLGIFTEAEGKKRQDFHTTAIDCLLNISATLKEEKNEITDCYLHYLLFRLFQSLLVLTKHEPVFSNIRNGLIHLSFLITDEEIREIASQTEGMLDDIRDKKASDRFHDLAFYQRLKHLLQNGYEKKLDDEAIVALINLKMAFCKTIYKPFAPLARTEKHVKLNENPDRLGALKMTLSEIGEIYKLMKNQEAFAKPLEPFLKGCISLRNQVAHRSSPSTSKVKDLEPLTQDVSVLQVVNLCQDLYCN